jgi:hypothetical protein
MTLQIDNGHNMYEASIFVIVSHFHRQEQTLAYCVIGTLQIRNALYYRHLVYHFQAWQTATLRFVRAIKTTYCS